MAGRRQKKGQTASITRKPLAKVRITYAHCERILTKIAAGGTLVKAAEEEGVGYYVAWDKLTREYPTEYAMAKKAGTEALVEKTLERAMGSTSETAAGDRTQADFVKWLASRRSPGDYGDKQTVAIEKDDRIIIETETWIAPTGSEEITGPVLEAQSEKKSDAPD